MSDDVVVVIGAGGIGVGHRPASGCGPVDPAGRLQRGHAAVRGRRTARAGTPRLHPDGRCLVPRAQSVRSLAQKATELGSVTQLAGHRQPHLTAEQDQAPGHRPVEELWELPFINKETIRTRHGRMSFPSGPTTCGCRVSPCMGGDRRPRQFDQPGGHHDAARADRVGFRSRAGVSAGAGLFAGPAGRDGRRGSVPGRVPARSGGRAPHRQ